MAALRNTTVGTLLAVLPGATIAVGAGPGTVSFDLAVIGSPMNAADTSGLGAVARVFRLSTVEVTNAQYVAFLNATAASDPHGLFDPLMTSSDRGGILRSGTPGSFSYAVKPNFGDKPVNAIDWLDAARFCNWLHHGQPSGAAGPTTTEDGSYDLSQPNGAIARRAGATWFIPTHDEWYKAAYHDTVDAGADAGGTPDYWFYPTRSDELPAEAAASATGDVLNPGANVANHSGGADWNDENGNVTTVGGCAATSRYGLFDLGGNVNEWTETLGTPIPANPPGQPEPLPTRMNRGGDFANDGILMASPDFLAGSLNMVSAGANIGFRVGRAGSVPTDVNHDGLIDIDDIVEVVLAWGPCPPAPAACPADVDESGGVDIDDLVAVVLDFID